MHIAGISLNHKTSPIEVREALHLNKDEILDFIPRLKQEIMDEGFVLSTCNRTEIFGLLKNGSIDVNPIINALIEFKPIKGVSSDNFIKYYSCSALRHIYSVSTGIDSLIIGDSQILGQLKESFEISEELSFSGSLLKKFFDSAIKTGKRSIRETAIGEGAVSISYAAVQVVEKIFANLIKKSALVIGAGETGELAAVHLKDKGIGRIAISNRTLERAETLAVKTNGEIIPYEFLKDHIHNYDIIISATSAPNFILGFNDLSSAIKKRRGAPICLVDIAMPRDIDPEVKKIDNVFYNDIDSLKIIVDQNLQKRINQIPAVETIIMEELIGFIGWYNALEVIPTIKSVRDFFDSIRTDELDKIKNKVCDEDYVKLEDMTRRMIGRILHNPTIKLRSLAESGINFQETANYSFILKELFDIEHKNKEFNSPVNQKDKI